MPDREPIRFLFDYISPYAALDVKWSDSAWRSASAWSSLLQFASGHQLDTMFMTSRTVSSTVIRGGVRRVVLPLPMLCFEIGALAASQKLLRDRYVRMSTTYQWRTADDRRRLFPRGGREIGGKGRACARHAVRSSREAGLAAGPGGAGTSERMRSV